VYIYIYIYIYISKNIKNLKNFNKKKYRGNTPVFLKKN